MTALITVSVIAATALVSTFAFSGKDSDDAAMALACMTKKAA